MGFPAMRVRDFPGNREEANRAGITPRNLFGTIDHITSEGAMEGSVSGSVSCLKLTPDGETIRLLIRRGARTHASRVYTRVNAGLASAYPVDEEEPPSGRSHGCERGTPRGVRYNR